MKKKSITQKAIALIKGDTTTADERADKARRESIGLLMSQGVADYDGGVADIKEGGRCLIRGVNKIREAGRKFDQAEHIGQMEFRNWHTDTEAWEREAVRREKIKVAIRIFKLTPDRPETLEDCAHVIQASLQLAGIMPKSHRLGETGHEPMNPFNAIIDSAATIKNWFKEWEPEDSPFESYYAAQSVETLEKIKLAIKPMAERYAIVERLLAEKGEQ